MTKIKNLVDEISEELSGAKEYAETYLEYKVKGDNTWATRYKEMSQDELKHANYIHEKAVLDIEELRRVYTPPQEMLDAWETAHKLYVERAAWIKQMLSM